MKSNRYILGAVYTISSGVADEMKENYYQRSMRPVLTLLYNHPTVRTTFYISGNLLSWLELNHPESLMVLSEMVKRKQLEILGGGYFEPCIPLISSQDKLGQIELMTTTIRKFFGKRPRGLWLPELLWDTSLPSTLKSCAIEYSFLNDFFFNKCGIETRDIQNSYLTEDQGKNIFILSVDSRFQELLIDGRAEEAVDYFKGILNDKIRNLTAFFVPYHKIINDRNLIDKAFTVLSELVMMLSSFEDNKTILPESWIRTRNSISAKLYFPTSTYMAIDGGTERQSYRHFLVDYIDANYMYSKMIYVNLLCTQIRGDKSKKKTAKEYIWKGQNLYGFIPSETQDGGIFNINNRNECYMALIEAEKMTRERGVFRSGINVIDFDLDGKNEYLYQGFNFNAYVHRKSGMLFELDYIPDCKNYLNTFTPKNNNNIQQNKKIMERKGFVDHIYPVGTEIVAPEDIQEKDRGIFSTSIYSIDGCSKENSWVSLYIKGPCLEGNHCIEIKKKYLFRRNSLELYYSIQNINLKPLEFSFSSELNLSLSETLRDDSDYLFYYSEKEDSEVVDFIPGAAEEISPRTLLMENLKDGTDITVSFSKTPKLKTFILRYKPEIYSGETSFYQSHVFFPVWDIKLKPNEIWKENIVFRINKHKTI